MSTNDPGRSRREPMSEERVDVRRYLDALRRSRGLIISTVVLVTGVALLMSLLLPKTYVGTARIVLDQQTSPLGQTDAVTTQRQLATTDLLLTTPPVLSAAARRVPGETADTIAAKVSSAVDADTNVITINASDGRPAKAAQIANAVTEAFLQERARVDRARIGQARAQLQQQIQQLAGQPNAADQLPALRQRLSDLTVGENSAGSDLQIAERATPPDSASSPRPIRNSVLAFFAALFLGVLLALARDQLVPRVSGARELGRILEAPVLAGVPYVRGRMRRRKSVMTGVELEAYQTVRAALELALGGEQKQMILVTGALHAEGKTTATARLGRALAQAGRKTLLVSVDLRVPRLHEMFDLDLGMGVSDILAVLDWDPESLDSDLIEQATHVVMSSARRDGGRGELHVITSGTKAKDPGRLISGRALGVFLDRLRQLDYDYVLVDGPPLLGIADSQLVGQQVDDILVVSRLDRITIEHATELRDVLDRLPTPPVGIVVIGARGEMSPYYLSRRPGLLQEETSG